MQLLISPEPGIFTIADVTLAAGEYTTDEIAVKLNHSSKFASVRKEVHLMGYFHDSDEPQVPVSPVDIAFLETNETIYIPLYVSTATPASGLIPGQVDFPGLAPYLIGLPIVLPYKHQFDAAEGKVVNKLYAFTKGTTNSQIFDWGVSLVLCISQRAGMFRSAVTQQIKVGTIITVSGSSSVGGTSFNGAEVVTVVTGQQTFQYYQALGVDQGGGGSITYGYPSMTAKIVSKPNGLYRDSNGNVSVLLEQPPQKV